MKRKGMWAVFSDEDIELMLAIRREAEARAAKAAQRTSRPERPAKSREVKTTSDPETTKGERPGSS
jgi:hypothetical protein